MKKEQQENFYDKLNRTIQPAKDRGEPEIWFRELRVLDSLSVKPDQERQRIVLHRGFNILWAAPEDPDTEQGLYRDGLAGHASGKTLFCRILRHLLGEEPFGTNTQRDGIAKNFLTLWVVASIRVKGESWIVGRPLAAAGEKFAVQAETINEILLGELPSGGYEDFLMRLRNVGDCVEPLYPEQGWRHLLLWLARDQEARFSSLAAWREASSQGDNPQNKVNDRHQVMRAVLGLLDLREPALRQDLDASIARLESGRLKHSTADTELAGQVTLANLRTVELLGDNAPIETEQLQARLTSLAEVMREAVEGLEKRPTPQAVLDAQKRLNGANKAVSAAETELEGLEPQITSLKERQQRDLTLIRNFRSGNVEDPSRVVNNFCPNSIQTAVKRQCYVPAKPSAESASSVAEMERQAQEDTKKIATAEARAKQLEKILPGLRTAADTADEVLTKVQRDSNRDIAALSRKAERAEEVSRLFNQIEKTKTAQVTATEKLTTLASEIETKKADITKLRDDMDVKVQAFSNVFADIIRAVMGASVDPKVSVTNEGIVPHVTRKGELSGAALDTIKTLAFDLAAVVASIEGQGSHPRFLIHDGPREGDMARIIYERFFIYAAGIEAAFASREDSSFQYIITTTTPPPKNMRQGSRWLLKPVLDSRRREQRLLKEDF